MHWVKNTASRQEITDCTEYNWGLKFRERSTARAEAASEVVEECTLEAMRIWTLNSCDGAYCCPNEWLVESAEGEFFWLSSWDFLARRDNRFPGQTIWLRRWPVSHRIIAAKTSGPDLPFSPWSKSLDQAVQNVLRSSKQTAWLRCLELPSRSIPEHLLQVDHD